MVRNSDPGEVLAERRRIIDERLKDAAICGMLHDLLSFPVTFNKSGPIAAALVREVSSASSAAHHHLLAAHNGMPVIGHGPRQARRPNKWLSLIPELWYAVASIRLRLLTLNVSPCIYSPRAALWASKFSFRITTVPRSETKYSRR